MTAFAAIGSEGASRLLVLGPKEALPRFVTLVARRP